MAPNHLGIFSVQPDELNNERIAWLQEWLNELYGGTLPQPHRGNSSVDMLDDLVAQLDNASLDQIKATMSYDIQAKVHVDGMNEHELKSLVVSAAEMSTLITGTGKMSIAPSADNNTQVVDEDMEMADAEDEPMFEDSPSAAPAEATTAHISADWSDWEEHRGAGRAVPQSVSAGRWRGPPYALPVPRISWAGTPWTSLAIWTARLASLSPRCVACGGSTRLAAASWTVFVGIGIGIALGCEVLVL
jgi:hypothetical protein